MSVRPNRNSPQRKTVTRIEEVEARLKQLGLTARRAKEEAQRVVDYEASGRR